MSQVQKSKLLSKSRSLVSALTAAARRRLPKPPVGAVLYLQPLLTVYNAHRDQMQIAGLDADSLVAMFDAYTASEAQEQAAKAAYQKVKDTRLQQLSTIWSFMLEIYALAQAIARQDSDVAAAITGFAAFLKHRSAKKGSQPATSTTPVTSPNSATSTP